MTTSDPATVVCRRCGVIPAGWRTRRPACLRCRVTERLERLLDEGAGRINPALQPLVDALLADARLESVRGWLYKPHAAELLAALAAGRVPLTHDGLASWPHATTARHLRHRLVACGVLPPVDRHLADIELWLHRRLGQLADHPHVRLLRQFALWHQLPRLRTAAARRPLRPNAKQYATQQFTQADAFLTWLHAHAIAPNRVAQADIDAWYATHRVHQRQLVRGFLTWAIRQGHLPRNLDLPRVAFRVGAAITQQHRLDLIRRYATDQTVGLHLRVAACVLLLYGQPLSRIHRLTRHDLIDSGTESAIRLGDPPTPVPQPFADLLRHLATTARETPSGWLFPGQYIDQPIAYTTIGRHLRALGFPLIAARVAALRHLVQEIPAPVVADALGFHQTSTARQVVNAGATWSRYPTNQRNDRTEYMRGP